MNEFVFEILNDAINNHALADLITARGGCNLTFSQLCENKTISNYKDLEFFPSLSDENPCVITVDDSNEGKIAFTVLILNKYNLTADYKIRTLEIINAINNVMKTHKGYKLGVIKFAPISEEISSYDISYNYDSFYDEDDVDDEEYSNQFTFFDYYNSDFYTNMRELFSSNEIKQLLYSNGKDGTDMTFEELIDNGMLKFCGDLKSGENSDNIFTCIDIEFFMSTNISISTFGITNAENDSNDISQRAAKLSESLKSKMLEFRGVSFSSGNSNCKKSCALYVNNYTIPQDKNKIEVIENDKKLKINFFGDMDVLEKANELDDDSYLNQEHIDLGFSFDLIQLPLHMTMFSLSGELTFNLYERNEFALYDNTDFSVAFRGDGSDPKVNVSGKFSQDSVQNLIKILEYTDSFKKYILNNNLLEKYKNIDKENQGILTYIENDTIMHKIVSGKERPSLMSTSLFNGDQMIRPYKDEESNMFNIHMFDSFEDKVSAAEDGDVGMMIEIANAYSTGSNDYDEVEIDIEKSLYWMKKAAEEENSTAMFNLGVNYLKGTYGSVDLEEALKWLQMAEEYGDDDAPNLVLFINELLSVKEKALNGDANSQAEFAEEMMVLGKQAEDGDACYKEALKWANKAAKAKIGLAFWVLALCYENARGVEEDLVKAFEYYEEGADLGYAPCQHSLGCFYINGNIVDTDIEYAVSLFKQAAKQNYALAFKDLGRCYQFGNGVTEDTHKAIEFYEKYLENNYDPELEALVMTLKFNFDD